MLLSASCFPLLLKKSDIVIFMLVNSFREPRKSHSTKNHRKNDASTQKREETKRRSLKLWKIVCCLRKINKQFPAALKDEARKKSRESAGTTWKEIWWFGLIVPKRENWFPKLNFQKKQGRKQIKRNFSSTALRAIFHTLWRAFEESRQESRSRAEIYLLWCSNSAAREQKKVLKRLRRQRRGFKWRNIISRDLTLSRSRFLRFSWNF